MKELADDNFKFDENGRKFFKRIENTVGKGETARYEQFLLFPAVFSKVLYCRHVKTRACLGKSQANSVLDHTTEMGGKPSNMTQ